MRAGDMKTSGTSFAVAAALLATLCMAATAVASPGDQARGGGVQLDLPSGWEKVSAARSEQADDPRTLLVIGTSLTNPDFAAFAASFGLHAWRVERTEEFAPALDRALAA